MITLCRATTAARPGGRDHQIPGIFPGLFDERQRDRRAQAQAT